MLSGGVDGWSDASYATTCAKAATFETAVAPCASQAAFQYLELFITSQLSGANVSASVCTASYLDYTILVQENGSWYTHGSARTYGKYESGDCVLGYLVNLSDDKGDITGIQLTADSYEVQSFSVPEAPPLIVSSPQAVEFYVTPMGSP